MAAVMSSLQDFGSSERQEGEEIGELTEAFESACSLTHIAGASTTLLKSQEEVEAKEASEVSETQGSSAHDNCDSWICAICMDKIQLKEFSQVKGCEHSYCITCILRWASYKQSPWCPQCRNPFEMLYLYKTLDGSTCDYMVEEPVCLLLCASWFQPLQLEEAEFEEDYFEADEYYGEEEDIRYPVRIGNRRWGEHGYVRGGRMEARPRVSASHGGASDSSSSRNKAAGGASASTSAASSSKPLGRRAKRAQQRQDADKVAGGKQQQQRPYGGRR